MQTCRHAAKEVRANYSSLPEDEIRAQEEYDKLYYGSDLDSESSESSQSDEEDEQDFDQLPKD